MQTLYLLCGMPFSGKTNLGKSLAEYLNSAYVSLDEINEARGLQGGEGIPVAEWEKTHSLAMQQLPSLMQSRQDIVIDDTSCFRWLRERWRNFAQQYNYQTIIIFLNLPLATIAKRMEQNKQTQARHSVRQDIVEQMATTFEFPQEDENAIEYCGDRSIEDWIAKHFALFSN